LVWGIETRNTLGVLYISYSVADGQRHVSHCFLFTMAQGWSQLLTRSNGDWGESKNSKGAHLSLYRQRQNMKGNGSSDNGKNRKIYS